MSQYTGIKSFNFLCWTLRIVGQKVSTKSLMAVSNGSQIVFPLHLVSFYPNIELSTA